MVSVFYTYRGSKNIRLYDPDTLLINRQQPSVPWDLPSGPEPGEIREGTYE